ncbi:MAG: hypothetical protein IJH47_05515 [Oscillospiraceae bacterium]|nr:hypothetical protein [Oscillospiraceae bacterium]
MPGSERKPSLRARVTATLAVTTVLFLALLAGGLFLAEKIPQWRQERAEAALAAGDLSLARRIAARLEEEESRALLRRCDYAEAAELMAAGDFAGARAAFLALGNYADSPEQARESAYREAETVLAAGDPAAAAAAFRTLSGYRDSAARADECAFRAAEETARTAPRAAIDQFLALGDYPGARDRAVALARAITGETDEETALALAQDLTPEEIARREELKKVRESLPRDVVDAGFYHTVGLRSDGTVLACGDDSFGQCDVAAWTEITAVAAGAYHTVGLRADGTVAAVGRNSEHQCDVDGWRDVVQIAAADYATFGLRADGTVVSCGFNEYYMLSGWTGVTRITGGSHNLGALRGSGEPLSSHVSSRWESPERLVDLAVNTALAVGLRADGTVTALGAELEDWSGIVAVSAGSTAVLGLRADGSVCAFFFREGDALDVSGLSRVIALAAGGTHCAFVHEDGSVTVLGDNAHGEADTGGWRLFGS